MESGAKNYPELSLARPERSALLFRPSSGGQGVLHATLEENLAELGRFVSYAEQGLTALFGADFDDRRIASALLALYREMVRRESDVVNFEDGVDIFLHQLHAERFVYPIAQSVFRTLRNYIYGPAAHIDRRLLHNSRAHLSWIIDWYARRKRSLLLIAEQEERYRFDPEEADRVFDFSCVEDVERMGVRGIELSCGLRLFGYSGRMLWLRAQARVDTTLIKAASGSSIWSEVPAESGAGGAAARPTFAALSPLGINAQFCLLDRVVIFLPYCEMDIPPDAKQLELELAVLDEDGTQLLVSSCLTRIDRGTLDRSIHIPSANALGFWSKDFVSRDSISELEIELDHASGDLNVEFELNLISQRGRSVQLQARLIRPDASGIEDGENSAAAAVLNTQEISIPSGQLYALSCKMALELDALKDFALDQRLLLEVVAAESSGRLLCGNLRLLPEDLLDLSSAIRSRQESSPETLSPPAPRVGKFWRLLLGIA